MGKQKYEPTRAQRRKKEQEKLDRAQGIKPSKKAVSEAEKAAARKEDAVREAVKNEPLKERAERIDVDGEAFVEVNADTPVVDAGFEIPESSDAVPVVRSKKLQPKELAVIATSIVLVIALVITAIFVWLRDPKLGTNNPVAIIEVQRGGTTMTLEFELFYELAPTAVQNFIHLANQTVFNDSVIHKLEDNQMFGGRFSSVSPSGNNNDNISIFRRFSNQQNSQNLYSFEVMKIDPHVFGNILQQGYISMVQVNSPTAPMRSEFRINLEDIVHTSGVWGVVFGQYRGEETLRNLRTLARSEVFVGTVIPRETIRIRSVRIVANDKSWQTYRFNSNHAANTDYRLTSISGN
jgi:cyclophilin family peptidyl-prolyl cis-trans isomerase